MSSGDVRGGKRGEGGFYALSALSIAVVCAILAMTRVADYARSGRSISFGESLAWDETSGLALLVLLPAITWLARRFDATTPPHGRALAVHALASVPFSLAHVALMSVFRWIGYTLLGRSYAVLGLLGDWLYEYRKDVITYASMLGVYWGWRALMRLRAAAAAPQARVVAPTEPIEVRDGSRRLFVRPEDILWIEAAGNYAELHLSDRNVLHRASLASLEARLGPCGFARIHRARLVSRAQIAALTANAAGDFTVTLRDGRALAGSRRYRAALTRLETTGVAD